MTLVAEDQTTLRKLLLDADRAYFADDLRRASGLLWDAVVSVTVAEMRRRRWEVETGADDEIPRFLETLGPELGDDSLGRVYAFLDMLRSYGQNDHGFLDTEMFEDFHERALAYLTRVSGPLPYDDENRDDGAGLYPWFGRGSELQEKVWSLIRLARRAERCDRRLSSQKMWEAVTHVIVVEMGRRDSYPASVDEMRAFVVALDDEVGDPSLSGGFVVAEVLRYDARSGFMGGQEYRRTSEIAEDFVDRMLRLTARLDRDRGRAPRAAADSAPLVSVGDADAG